jgi:hypothetical protein
MKTDSKNIANNHDWMVINKCNICKYRTAMDKDHCNIIVNKPTQLCPFFKEK